MSAEHDPLGQSPEHYPLGQGPEPEPHALSVQGLHIAFGTQVVVDGIDLHVNPGECLAIVGESGAGKSLTALALLGLLPDAATVRADRLEIDGVEAQHLGDRGWRALRGARIGLVSQDALVSLDPLRRVGNEVAEPLDIHRPALSRTQRDERVIALLREAAVPDPERRARQLPAELSGGLRQRALIASALAAAPGILVADEPTTALDATVQVRILELLRDVAARGVAVIFISHDLGAVARVADRVAVMRGGLIVEQGTVAHILRAPQHEYTRQLVAASALGAPRRARPVTSPAPALSARGLRKFFGDTPAAADVTFDVHAGRTLGIVGESGSGKTTVARLLMGIETPDAGTVTLVGEPWNPAPEASRRARRSRVQLVHQNPRGAFDPRWSIGRSLYEALAAGGMPRAERSARARELMTLVELDPALLRRRARQLSGGQRQRAAIARALAVNPDVLVLDEPVSALDVSVQAKILALLDRLQRELNLAMVLISHDLRVIAAHTDDVLVMQHGAVVEQGPVARVFGDPRHPFTRELLAAGAQQR